MCWLSVPCVSGNHLVHVQKVRRIRIPGPCDRSITTTRARDKRWVDHWNHLHHHVMQKPEDSLVQMREGCVVVLGGLSRIEYVQLRILCLIVCRMQRARNVVRAAVEDVNGRAVTVGIRCTWIVLVNGIIPYVRHKA